jgi:hypothetical protein
MSFFRQQEERLAIRFARERGRNVIAIIKDLVNDIKK